MKFAGAILRWILTLGLLLCAFYQAPPKQWIPLFSGIHWTWLSAAIGAMASIVLVNTWKWHILLGTQGLKTSYSRALYHYAVGYFFNSFITGTGDIKRATDLGKENKAVAESLASVLAERWTGVIGQVGLAGCTLSVALLQTPAVWPIAVCSLLMVAMLAILYMWFEGAKHGRQPSGEGLWCWVYRVRLALSIYKGHRALWWTCLALSFVGPLLLVVIHICLAHALGIQVDYWAMLVFVPTVSVFSQLPVTINGFGLQDYFMITLFAGAFTPAEALAISMVFHALRLGVGTTGGLIYALAPRLGLSAEQGD